MGDSNPTAFEKGSVVLVESILLVRSENGNFVCFQRNNCLTKKILT